MSMLAVQNRSMHHASIRCRGILLPCRAFGRLVICASADECSDAPMALGCQARSSKGGRLCTQEVVQSGDPGAVIGWL